MISVAYNTHYLSIAQRNLATLFHYAINYKKRDIKEFFNEFITSGYAYYFGKGYPNIVAGLSGIELYHLITNTEVDVSKDYLIKRSKEYWLGYYLAYAQWYLNVSFSTISYVISIDKLLELYNPYHEADVTKFCEYIYELLIKENHLKEFREELNISQNDLYMLSHVNIRSIKAYEQGSLDINKASFPIIKAFSNVFNYEIDVITSIDDFKYKCLKENKLFFERLKNKIDDIDRIYIYKSIIDTFINKINIYKIAYINKTNYINKKYITNLFVTYFYNILTINNKENDLDIKLNKLAKAFIIGNGDIVTIDIVKLIEASYKAMNIN